MILRRNRVTGRLFEEGRKRKAAVGGGEFAAAAFSFAVRTTKSMRRLGARGAQCLSAHLFQGGITTPGGNRKHAHSCFRQTEASLANCAKHVKKPAQKQK